MAITFEYLGEFFNDAFTENKARGGTILEILHIRSFYNHTKIMNFWRIFAL